MTAKFSSVQPYELPLACKSYIEETLLYLKQETIQLNFPSDEQGRDTNYYLPRFNPICNIFNDRSMLSSKAKLWSQSQQPHTFAFLQYLNFLKLKVLQGI